MKRFKIKKMNPYDPKNYRKSIIISYMTRIYFGALGLVCAAGAGFGLATSAPVITLLGGIGGLITIAGDKLESIKMAKIIANKALDDKKGEAVTEELDGMEKNNERGGR